MSEIVHLQNAPIREAVIDIKVQTSTEVDPKGLQQLEAMLGDGFHDFEPTVRKGLGVEFGEDGVTTTHNESLIGYKAEDKDRGVVVQFQSNGLTLSKLEPYTNWQDFENCAKEAWNLYRECLPKFKVSRVATRFINVMELPYLEGLNLDEYLTSSPKLPAGLGDTMSSFFTRIVVPKPELDAVAIIMQNVEPPKKDKLTVTLDIDVYRTNALTENTIWQILKTFQDVKNQAFFGSITDLTVELYK